MHAGPVFGRPCTLNGVLVALALSEALQSNFKVRNLWILVRSADRQHQQRARAVLLFFRRLQSDELVVTMPCVHIFGNPKPLFLSPLRRLCSLKLHRTMRSVCFL